MVDRVIRIVLDSSGVRSGSQEIEGRLGNIDRSTRRVATSLRRLGAAIGITSAGVAIRQIVGLANSYQQLSNRVRVAVGEQGDLNGTLDELFEIADRTRAPIEAITQLYQRGALAANELGASQEQLLQFTETVGTALALQGGAASQASGALLQLSQSLGSGIVRAEEFNSILEGAFPIALAAAKGIDEAGGSVARLRQLIIQGKITSDEFFNGILTQSDDLERQFGTTAGTVDQALTRIRNALIRAAGSADLDPLVDSLNDLADLISDPTFQQGFASFVGGVVDLAGGTVSLASEFGRLGDEIGFFAARVGGGVTEVQLLEQELKGVRQAISAETTGGITGFLVKPIAFTGDSIEELQTEEQRILDEIAAINARLGLTPVSVETEVSGGPDEPTVDPIDPELLKKQTDFLAGLADANAQLEIQTRLGDAAADALARYATEQEIIALQLTPAQAEAARALTEAIIDQNRELERQAEIADQRGFIESLEEQEERLRIQATAGDDAEAALRRYDVTLRAIATGGGPEFVKLAVDIADGITAQAAALEELQNKAADLDLVAGLEEELRLLGLTNRERAIEAELRRLSTDATQAQIDAVTALAGKIFDEEELLRSRNATLQALSDQAARNIQDAFADFLFDPFEDGLEGLVRGFADALRRMLANAIATDLASAIGLSDLTGGLLGGLGGGASAPPPRAFGGGISAGQTVLAGERGPELVTPASASRVFPAQQTAAMLGAPQAAAPNITLVNTIDDSEITGAFNSGAGDTVLLNRMSRRSNAFRRALGIQGNR